MKKIVLAVTCAMAMAATSAQALENTVKPTVTKLGVENPAVALLVGNSYSFYNCGVHGYLRGMNKEAMPKLGWKMRISTTSSAPLSLQPVEWMLGEHEEEPYAADKKSGAPKFDVVILQPHSQAATNAKRVPSFEKNAAKHIAAIKKSGAAPVLVMTWAREDKPGQTKVIADEATKVGNENGALVVPVGLAFAEAKKGMPGLKLHQKDKSHPTAAGSYIYGAMLHAALFKHSPEGLKYLGECEKPLDPKLAAYLQGVVWKTAKEYYGW
jgi:hypothetical protein